jgi:hypothetical protein
VVFDNSLSSAAGSSTDFDLFAPILNIIQQEVTKSPWLQAFDNRNTWDSPFLPELFVDFDLAPNTGADLWGSNFDATPKAVVSFAGPQAESPVPIPEPGTLAIFSMGLATLPFSLRLRRAVTTGLN